MPKFHPKGMAVLKREWYSLHTHPWLERVKVLASTIQGWASYCSGVAQTLMGWYPLQQTIFIVKWWKSESYELWGTKLLEERCSFFEKKCVSICLRSCPSSVQSLNAINFIICNVLYQSCYIILGKQGCFYWEYCSLQNFLYWEGTAIMLSSRPQNNTPPVQYSSLFETKGVTSHKLLDSLSLVADRVRWVPQGQKLGTNWLLKANQNWISCLGTAEQTS